MSNFVHISDQGSNCYQRLPNFHLHILLSKPSCFDSTTICRARNFPLRQHSSYSKGQKPRSRNVQEQLSQFGLEQDSTFLSRNESSTQFLDQSTLIYNRNPKDIFVIGTRTIGIPECNLECHNSAISLSLALEN